MFISEMGIPVCSTFEDIPITADTCICSLFLGLVVYSMWQYSHIIPVRSFTTALLTLPDTRFSPFLGLAYALIVKTIPKTCRDFLEFSPPISIGSFSILLIEITKKIYYDNPGNVPNKGRNFNKKTLGKCIYLLFVWLAVIGFRQSYLYILPNFGDFGAKMSFFHYIINQKRNHLIKHCPPPPPRVPRSRLYQRCVSI